MPTPKLEALTDELAKLICEYDGATAESGPFPCATHRANAERLVGEIVTHAVAEKDGEIAELKQNEIERQTLRAAMEQLAKLVGIDNPLIMWALTVDDENPAQGLVRILTARLTEKDAEIAALGDALTRAASVIVAEKDAEIARLNEEIRTDAISYAKALNVVATLTARLAEKDEELMDFARKIVDLLRSNESLTARLAAAEQRNENAQTLARLVLQGYGYDDYHVKATADSLLDAARAATPEKS